MSLHTCPTKKSLWIGWKSKHFQGSKLNEVKCRKFGIYPQINQSPTSDVVVDETSARAQKVAEECAKRTILVTYDLVIAKSRCIRY